MYSFSSCGKIEKTQGEREIENETMYMSECVSGEHNFLYKLKGVMVY